MSTSEHQDDEIQLTPQLLKLKSGQFSLKSITTLNLSHLGIRIITEHLKECRYLKRLDLSHNTIRRIENLSGMPHLEHLDLSYNQISKLPSSELESLKKLDSLNMKGNLVTDLSQIENLSVLPNLRVVYFANNSISQKANYDEKLKSHVKKLMMIDGEHILLRLPKVEYNQKEKIYELSKVRPWDEDEGGESLFQMPSDDDGSNSGSLAKQFPQLVSQYKSHARDCQRLIARADSLLEAS